MPLQKAVWKPNQDLPLGRGATAQQFIATFGSDKLEINVAPWGEGDLKVNGVEIAHITDGKNRRQVFLALKKVAERHLQALAKPSSGATKKPK